MEAYLVPKVLRPSKNPVNPIFDEIDSDLLTLNWTSKDGYAFLKRHIDGKQIIFYAHRVVAARKLGRELKTSEQVDHDNHNPIDCTRNNLMITNSSGNGHNRVGAQKNNKSGILGVRFKSGKYEANIRHNYKSKYLGRFDTMEEASQVYLDEREKFLATR